jgi:hypothetical protein
MRRVRKPKGPKRVSYKLIEPTSDHGQAMYRQLRTLVQSHHQEIREARIALAWCTSWRRDVDGFITLGKCKKASDLDRELAAFDFIVLLSKSFWTDPLVTDAQREALLDHELSHASVKVDFHGEPERDERGRQVFRIRKHDIEEFAAVVERHGLYKRDLAHFAASLRRSALAGFEPCEQCKLTPGWIEGANGVSRCECYRAWQSRLSA